MAPLRLEAWESDLEFARSLIDRQAFAEADAYINSHLHIRPPDGATPSRSFLDLLAMTYTLAGDSLRDQGRITGPGGARWQFRMARSLYWELGRDARLARLQLMLAVCDEMVGSFQDALRTYSSLTSSNNDNILPYDVERATLWMGTALTKLGMPRQAIAYIHKSIAYFMDRGLTDMVGNAYQKLALAYLAANDPAGARAALELAASSSDMSTPLTHTRFKVASAHVFGANDDLQRSYLLLDEATELSSIHGLGHQLLAIDAIRTTLSRTTPHG